MHLSLILIAVTIACCVRLCYWRSEVWVDRWQRTLGLFLFSPLLLLMTAVAMLCMGTKGQMFGLPVGWIGYCLSIGFLSGAGSLLLWRGWQGWRSLRQVQTYPQFNHQGTVGRILDTSSLFAAQVGFWQPELVASRGLLAALTPDQISAVLTHEQAHSYYRDTFWFFGLGWLRQLSIWLPNTEALWQELLLLRELRADQWAAERVDALLVAESLLLVVQAPLQDSENYCAAFGANCPPNRLEERIEALIEAPVATEETERLPWVWLILAFIPMLTVVLHR
jgi:Zn-dependent protease with chaperone function